jgi:hypothetical protein
MRAVLRKTKTAFALALGIHASAAMADDAALYDEAAPADAVFLRVLSDTGEPQRQVEFAGVQLSLGADLLDTYVAISAAHLTGVAAGDYYSIAAGPLGPWAIEEPARETAAKVHLVLVNAGPEPVRLIAPSQGLEVVARLEPGEAASRAVNPVEITLAVERIRDRAVLGRFDVRLSRGQNLTFVAAGASARVIENRFGPVLKLN